MFLYDSGLTILYSLRGSQARSHVQKHGLIKSGLAIRVCSRGSARSPAPSRRCKPSVAILASKIMLGKCKSSLEPLLAAAHPAPSHAFGLLVALFVLMLMMCVTRLPRFRSSAPDPCGARDLRCSTSGMRFQNQMRALLILETVFGFRLCRGASLGSVGQHAAGSSGPACGLPGARRAASLFVAVFMVWSLCMFINLFILLYVVAHRCYCFNTSKTLKTEKGQKSPKMAKIGPRGVPQC